MLLVQPNITWVLESFEHLGLAYLAASLRRAGFTVKLLDGVLLKTSATELAALMRDVDAKVVGVTLVSHGFPTVVSLLEAFRGDRPGCKIVAGGHFATFGYEKILAHTDVFDAIVLGEGEHALVQYCKSVIRGDKPPLTDVAMRGVQVSRSHSRVMEMDDLPFPSRDNLLLSMQRGATPAITASRGCYARCSFCTVHNFYTVQNGPRWVARSIPNVIDELRELRATYGIESFQFVDDNFIGPGPLGKRRALDFADAYTKSGLPMTFHIDCRANDVDEETLRALKAAGLRSIFMGIESISQADLKLYRKGLRAETSREAVRLVNQLGLEFWLSMIMFNPETTDDDILQNVEFVRSIGQFPRNPLSILNFYEGTDLTTSLAKYVTGPFWDYRFEFAHEKTRRIYDVALRFIKGTLALERRLSNRSEADAVRGRLIEMRWLFLEDLTRRLDQDDAKGVVADWSPRYKAIELEGDGIPRPSQGITGPRSADERLYQTKSALDLLPAKPAPEGDSGATLLIAR